MKSLKEYIINNYNVNEGFVLACLAGYFASWAIRKTFTTAENIRDTSKTLTYIWNTVFESKIEEAEDEKIETNKNNLKTQDIKPIQIPNDEILMKAIESTKPKRENDDDGDGLWTIKEKITKVKELAHIDKAPYYPNYAAFVTENKEICGMFGFSTKFWKAHLKSDNDKIKNLAKEYKNALHIFDLEICKGFPEDVIYTVFWDIFKKMTKELKVTTVTIHADNEKESIEYKKHGFEEIPNSKEYLVLNLNSK